MGHLSKWLDEQIELMEKSPLARAVDAVLTNGRLACCIYKARLLKRRTGQEHYVLRMQGGMFRVLSGQEAAWLYDYVKRHRLLSMRDLADSFVYRTG